MFDPVGRVSKIEVMNLFKSDEFDRSVSGRSVKDYDCKFFQLYF